MCWPLVEATQPHSHIYVEWRLEAPFNMKSQPEPKCIWFSEHEQNGGIVGIESHTTTLQTHWSAHFKIRASYRPIIAGQMMANRPFDGLHRLRRGSYLQWPLNIPLFISWVSLFLNGLIESHATGKPPPPPPLGAMQQLSPLTFAPLFVACPAVLSSTLDTRLRCSAAHTWSVPRGTDCSSEGILLLLISHL